MTGRSSSITKANISFRSSTIIPESNFGGFLAKTDYRDPVDAQEIESHGYMIWPLIHYLLPHDRSALCRRRRPRRRPGC